MKDIRYVVLHAPGPAWEPGKSPFEQAGAREHAEYYRGVLADGKLEMGGPHLDERGGGMMIPTAGVDEAEVRRFAAEGTAGRLNGSQPDHAPATSPSTASSPDTDP